MSAFRSVSVCAFPKLPLQNDSTSDSCSKCKEHQTRRSAPAAKLRLGIGGRIGVIDENCRSAELLADPGHQREILPTRQIERVPNHSSVQIERAGSSNTNCTDSRPTDASVTDSAADHIKYSPQLVVYRRPASKR